MSRHPDHYPSLTVYRETPEGTAYIHIAEDSPGRIFKIIFHIGKAGSTLNAYCQALAELTTELLKSGYSITSVINLLADISSDRAARLGVEDKSGPEALANALRMYVASSEPIAGERNPPRFTNAKS